MATSVAGGRRHDRGLARFGRVADGRALLAVPRRGHRAARPHRGGRARRGREDAGYGVHAGWGPAGWFTDARPRRAAGRWWTWACTRSTRRGSCWAIPSPGGCAPPSAPGTPRALHGGRRRDPADPLDATGPTASSSRDGGSRTWAAWRPTPRSTAPRATRASGRPRTRPRTTNTAPSRCTRRRWREFLDAIEEGRQPRPSGEDGRVVMQVVEAAYASAAGGGRVTIVLGVDGGGTKTHAAVADERGTLLGFGMSGPRTGRTVGSRPPRPRSRRPSARRSSAAGARAGTSGGSVFGLAGIDFPSDAAGMGASPRPSGWVARTRS